MKCDRCNQTIEPGEERSLYGQVLCEDCAMDALSPTRTCDPWAVHSAKSFAKETGRPRVNGVQAEILELLKKTGGMERGRLSEQLEMKPADLEREIASLRHMEMVRGERREGNRVFLVLW